jgi:hypothetical protein
MHHTARCYCGQLSITVKAPPVHYHGCACTLCQRRSGSVMSLSGWFRDEDVVAISGETRTWYSDGEDHPDILTAFCPVCGGGGFFRSGSYLPDTIGIAMGGFAGAFGAPEHIHFWGYRPGWFNLDAPGVALNEDP